MQQPQISMLQEITLLKLHDCYNLQITWLPINSHIISKTSLVSTYMIVNYIVINSNTYTPNIFFVLWRWRHLIVLIPLPCLRQALWCVRTRIWGVDSVEILPKSVNVDQIQVQQVQQIQMQGDLSCLGEKHFLSSVNNKNIYTYKLAPYKRRFQYRSLQTQEFKSNWQVNTNL